MASFSSIRAGVIDRQERRRHHEAHLLGLNAYDRHKKFMHEFVFHYKKDTSSSKEIRPIKTDQDTLRETYRFIRTEEDDLDNSWEQRLAKRYYDKLFKEYCIADMSRYKDGKIGLRWRSEKEVIAGKGQFICGNKHCDEKENLSSYEVNFAYKEEGQSKQALVKLRVCPGCGEKLSYRREKEHEKQQLESKKAERKKSESEGSSRSKRRRTTDNDDNERGLSNSEDSEDEDEKYFKGMFL